MFIGPKWFSVEVFLEATSEFGVSIMGSSSSHSANTYVEFSLGVVGPGAAGSVDEHDDGVVGGKVLPSLERVFGDLLQDGEDHVRVAIVIEDDREVCVRPIEDNPVGGVGHDKAFLCPMERDRSRRHPGTSFGGSYCRRSEG